MLSTPSNRVPGESVLRDLLALIRDPQKYEARLDVLGAKEDAAKKAVEDASKAKSEAEAILSEARATQAEADKARSEATAQLASLAEKNRVLDRQTKDATDERLRLKAELSQKIADADARVRAADEAKRIADARTADAEKMKAELAGKIADVDKRLARFKELAA